MDSPLDRPPTLGALVDVVDFALVSPLDVTELHLLSADAPHRRLSFFRGFTPCSMWRSM